MSGSLPNKGGLFWQTIEIISIGAAAIIAAIIAIALASFLFLAAVFFIQQAMELL